MNLFLFNWDIKEVEKLSNNGDNIATFYLGKFYYFGKSVETNKEKAFSLFKKSADLGYSESQLAVYKLLSRAIGCKEDKELALVYLDLACKQGLSDAIYEKAKLKLEEKEYKTSYDLFVKAMDKGNIDSYKMVIKCLKEAIGTKKDLEKAKALEDKLNFILKG